MLTLPLLIVCALLLDHAALLALLRALPMLGTPGALIRSLDHGWRVSRLKCPRMASFAAGSFHLYKCQSADSATNKMK